MCVLVISPFFLFSLQNIYAHTHTDIVVRKLGHSRILHDNLSSNVGLSLGRLGELVGERLHCNSVVSGYFSIVRIALQYI